MNVVLLRVCDKVEEDLDFECVYRRYGFRRFQLNESDTCIDDESVCEANFINDFEDLNYFVTPLKRLLSNSGFHEYLKHNKSDYLARVNAQIEKFGQLKKSKRRSLVRSLFNQYYRCVYKTTPIGYACSYQVYVGGEPQHLTNYRYRIICVDESVDRGLYCDFDGPVECNPNYVTEEDSTIAMYAWCGKDVVHLIGPGMMGCFIREFSGKVFWKGDFNEWVISKYDLEPTQVSNIFKMALEKRIFVSANSKRNLFQNSWRVSDCPPTVDRFAMNSILRVDSIYRDPMEECLLTKTNHFDLVTKLCVFLFSIGDLKKSRDRYFNKIGIRRGRYRLIDFLLRFGEGSENALANLKLNVKRQDIIETLQGRLTDSFGGIFLDVKTEECLLGAREFPEVAAVSLMRDGPNCVYNSMGSGTGRVLGRYADRGCVTEECVRFYEEREKKYITFVDPKGGSYLEQNLYTYYYTSEFPDCSLDLGRFVPLADILVEVTEDLEVVLYVEKIGEIVLVDNVIFDNKVKSQMSQLIACVFNRYSYCDKIVMSVLREMSVERVWLGERFLLKRRSMIVNTCEWESRISKRCGYLNFLDVVYDRIGDLFVCAKLGGRGSRPVFINFNLPYSLLQLKKLMRETKSFCLEEVCPSRNGCPQNEWVYTLSLK